MPKAVEILCESLTDRRGFRELFRELSFSVSGGQLLEITGANGSGKSTLLHCLTGLRRAESGRVCWQAQDVIGNREYFSQLRFVGHRNAVNPALTPRENLQIAVALAGEPDADLDAALHAVKLKASKDIPACRLSAGQRRRVALARLAASPGRIWILDEPFSSLDEQGRDWVVEAIRNFCHGGGMVVLTTHHLVEVPGLAAQRLRLSA